MQDINSFRSYLTAASKIPLSEAEQAYSRVGPSLGLRYRHVSYEAYLTQYRPDEWPNRKISAIPFALYSGVVKTTYHLFGVIFQGIPQLYSGNNELLKLHMYHIHHDVRESLGWIITVFNDKLGSYLVEESLFHQACYDIYVNRQRSPIDPVIIQHNNSAPHQDIWIRTENASYSNADRHESLQYFHQVSNLEKTALIEKFHLQPVIDELGGIDAFSERLNTTDPQLLRQVKLFNFNRRHPNDSIYNGRRWNDYASLEEAEDPSLAIRIALLSDAELALTPLSAVSSYTPKQLSMLSQRLTYCRTVIIEPGDATFLSIARFASMSGQDISVIIRDIPPMAFRLLNRSQTATITLSQISEEQIHQLFYFLEDNLTFVNINRLRRLSSEQLDQMLCQLPNHVLSCIPLSMLRSLENIALLNEEQLNSLFHEFTPTTRILRLSHILPDQLLKILPKMSSGLKEAISADISLPLNTLTSDELSEVLPTIPRQLYGQFKTISKEKLSALKVEGLGESQLTALICVAQNEKETLNRFRCISDDQLPKVAFELPHHLLKYIPDQLLDKIPGLGHWPHFLITNLFDTSLGSEVLSKRFASISPKVLRLIIKKIPKNLLHLIPNETLSQSGIDFFNLDNSEIVALFPLKISMSDTESWLNKGQARFSCIEKELRACGPELLDTELLPLIPNASLDRWIDHLDTSQISSLFNAHTQEQKKERFSQVKEKLFARLQGLPDRVLSIIPTEDFSQINTGQNWNAQRFSSLVRGSTNEETTDRLQAIDSQLLTLMLPKLADTDYQHLISLIPNNKLADIDITNIDLGLDRTKYRSRIRMLFSYDFSSEQKTARLDAIASKQLTELLPELAKEGNSYLYALDDLSLLTYISNQKLSSIDITALEQKDLKSLFRGCNFTQGRERFGCIPHEQQMKIAPKLSWALIRFIPNDRLAALFEIATNGQPSLYEHLCDSRETAIEVQERMSYLPKDLQKAMKQELNKKTYNGLSQMQLMALASSHTEKNEE